MPNKRRTRDTKVKGARIYERAQVTPTPYERGKTDTTGSEVDSSRESLNVQQSQETSPLYDVNHNSICDNELQASKSQALFSEQQFDNILDVLDQQTKTLNELRSRTDDKSSRAGEGKCQIDKLYEHLFTASENQRAAASRAEDPICRSLLSNRKSQLENYLRNNISQGAECACHFSFGSSELKLLDELNECYRKFCQFQSDQLGGGRDVPSPRPLCEQQVTGEEASCNFIGRNSIRENQADCATCTACLSASRASRRADESTCATDGLTSSDSLPCHWNTQKHRGLFIESQRSSSIGIRTRNNPRRIDDQQLTFSKSDSEIDYLTRDHICANQEHNKQQPASVFDCSQRSGHDTCRHSSDHDDGNEVDRFAHQKNALIGVLEDFSPSEPAGHQSPNEWKRKRHRALQPISSKRVSCSSLETSHTNQFDQFGCSLTNDSAASPGRHFSLSVAVDDDEDDDDDQSASLDLLASTYSLPASDECSSASHERYPEELLFIPEASCSNYKIEHTQAPPCWPGTSDERDEWHESTSSRCCSPSHAGPQAMESDTCANHDHGSEVVGASRLRDNAKLPAGFQTVEVDGFPLSQTDSACATNQHPSRRNYHTATDEEAQREPRLGTNAKTRLQQQGVEIEHEFLSQQQRPDESSNCTHDASMKAARDIAKLSIPSLASLQYLPGQVDVRGSRSVDRLAASKHAKATPVQMRRSNSMTQQPESVDNRQTNAEEQKKANPAENDNSCLLHRLCLCNCLAGSHTNGKKPKSRASDGRQSNSSSPTSIKSSPSRISQSARRATPPTKVRNVELPADFASRTSALSSSSSGNETNLCAKMEARPYLTMRNVTNGTGQIDELPRTEPQAERHELNPGQEAAKEHEKQSPYFLSLLKPTNSERRRPASSGSKAEKYEQYALAAHPQRIKGKLQQSRQRIAAATDGLGSIGDLAASGRSSASDSHTSEPQSPSVGYKSRSSSTKVYPDDARVGLAPSSKLSLPETKNKSPDKCESPSGRDKRVPSYKRLLSPRKLFNSSASSVCDCDEPQRSFLSRSLHRLSGRHKSCKNGVLAPTTSPQPESPSVSISNASQTDSYPDSINTLDELALSLPFKINDELLGKNYHSKQNAARLQRAPDIVLSQVEYQDVESGSSCDMTRSLSSANNHHNYRPSSAQSMHNHPERKLQASRCHGSELSFGTSDLSGSFSPHQGPFSLPGSPRVHRRQRNRSPRLHQSPVPFYSPANESTKIEDGLYICSTEHFEKHIGNIKDDQIETQKRLFAAWINHFAPNLIRHDLITELQDGIKLIGLLATLTHDKQLLGQYERLNRDKQSYINRLILTPSSRLKHLSNVSIAIEYLRKNLGLKLVNLNPMDIVSGKANVVLGLCWSIILHFQFDKNFLPTSYDSVSSHSSSSISQATSRSSHNYMNENGAREPKQLEEFTKRDLASARNRMLSHINKRFNLKLTNLTSSLVDGDVLLAIVRHLLPPDARLEMGRHVFNAKPLEVLTDDEKLDFAFQLARDHLNVPTLISAADLRRQAINENNSKPLLVYLSMLLKVNPRNCSTDQMLELRQLDESLKNETDEQGLGTAVESADDINSKLARNLDNIDTSDKFHIDKLQATISRIREIGDLIAESNDARLEPKLVERHTELKHQAEQVEFLINWINKADKLFETTPRSSSDLAHAIGEYQRFFSATNLPQVDTSLCPTLERQYRECLATARQRVMSMEQTMKNWQSYDRASQELKRWLVTAEAKLTEALRPGSHHGGSLQPPVDRPTNPVELHMSRLDELVEFFELEPIDMRDLDEYVSSPAGSSPSIDQSMRSLSNSLISLGSTSSHMSNLTSSKKAAHHRLFDEFELKCRLLAAMLEVEQRDELLLIVKELKTKLKYITEYKVPQVIGEIRMSINRCEMSIQEQNECCSDTELLTTLEPPSKQIEAASASSNGDTTSPSEQEPTSDDCRITKESQMISTAESNSELDNKKTDLSNKKAPKQRKANGKSRLAKSNKFRGNKARPSKINNPVVKTAIKLTQGKKLDDDDYDDRNSPYLRRFWNKIVRASKLSLSLNIVLLICLAGICVVPLIQQRDACCELNQSPISSDKFTVNQRPT